MTACNLVAIRFLKVRPYGYRALPFGFGFAFRLRPETPCGEPAEVGRSLALNSCPCDDENIRRLLNNRQMMNIAVELGKRNVSAGQSISLDNCLSSHFLHKRLMNSRQYATIYRGIKYAPEQGFYMYAIDVLKCAASAANVPITHIGQAIDKRPNYVSAIATRGSNPQCDTMASMLRVCGYELCAVPREAVTAEMLVID